jgi:hypothetical protein
VEQWIEVLFGHSGGGGGGGGGGEKREVEHKNGKTEKVLTFSMFVSDTDVCFRMVAAAITVKYKLYVQTACRIWVQLW